MIPQCDANAGTRGATLAYCTFPGFDSLTYVQTVQRVTLAGLSRTPAAGGYLADAFALSSCMICSSRSGVIVNSDGHRMPVRSENIAMVNMTARQGWGNQGTDGRREGDS